MEVPAGAAVTFNVSNEGPSPHTFGVKVGDKTYETPQIDVGRSATLEVPALEAGTYDSLCTIPGHDQLGMVGTVTATEGGTAAGCGRDDAAAGTDMALDDRRGDGRRPRAGRARTSSAGEETDTVRQPAARSPRWTATSRCSTSPSTEIQWEIATGEFVDAMAFNEQVPGSRAPRERRRPRPLRRRRTRWIEPFVLHFHGMTVPNSEDGVPYITQPPIMPGEYWTYEFTIKDPPGMYVYHSHFNSAEQVGAGLYGALIVEPEARDWSSVYGVQPDVEYTMFVGDGHARLQPEREVVPGHPADRGDEGRLGADPPRERRRAAAPDAPARLPLHVVVGGRVPARQGRTAYMADTLVVAPGSRFDILVQADYPGAWAFHCHILPHAEGPGGMFGMVTALVVQ